MKNVFFIFAILFSTLTAQAVCTTPSADLCNLANGGVTSINKFSTCKKITNGTGKAIMIASKTTAEWSSFFNNPPASVTLASCVAISYVTTKTAASANVTKPASLAVGDLMLATAYSDYNFTSTMQLNGFTYIDSPYATSGGYYSARFYKIATAGDVAGSGWNFSSTYLQAVMMAVVRNVDQTTPIQDHTRTSGTGTTINYTASTTVQDGSMIFLTPEGTSGVASLPTGFTSNFSSSPDATAFYTKIQATAGATGAISSTLSPSQTYSGSLVIINPL